MNTSRRCERRYRFGRWRGRRMQGESSLRRRVDRVRCGLRRRGVNVGEVRSLHMSRNLGIRQPAADCSGEGRLAFQFDWRRGIAEGKYKRLELLQAGRGEIYLETFGSRTNGARCAQVSVRGLKVERCNVHYLRPQIVMAAQASAYRQFSIRRLGRRNDVEREFSLRGRQGARPRQANGSGDTAGRLQRLQGQRPGRDGARQLRQRYCAHPQASRSMLRPGAADLFGRSKRFAATELALPFLRGDLPRPLRSASART